MPSSRPEDPSPSRFAEGWVYALVFGALAVMIWMLVEAHRIPAAAEAVPAGPRRPEARPGPAAIQFAEIRRFPTTVPGARGLAVGPDGSLYVAGGEIQVLDPQGSRLKSIPLQGAARCVAVDRAGRIYAGIGDHVEVFDRDGSRIARWKPFDRASVVTAVCAADPEVWVADAGRKTVWRCDALGKVKARFAEKDPARNVPGLVIPSPYFDVAMGPDGRLRVADTGRHQVEVYDLEGRLVSAWGHPSPAEDGFCGCCNPTDIAVLPDGRVATSEKKLPRVKLYGADGRFLGVIAGTDGFDPETAGIDLAADAQGRIFLLDPARREIRIYAEGKPPLR